MNPHKLLNEVGANYSTYCIRSFVGVLTRHLMEPNKYASWTLLLRLWAPASGDESFYCLSLLPKQPFEPHSPTGNIKSLVNIKSTSIVSRCHSRTFLINMT